MEKIVKAVLLLLCLLHVNASQIGFCKVRSGTSRVSFDLRCNRHNYTDFRDTHLHDLYGTLYDTLDCPLLECKNAHNCMKKLCKGNNTRECLNDCVNNHADTGHKLYPFPPCHFLPGEIDEYKLPSIYTLRISDELFVQNLILAREWHRNTFNGLGPEVFFHHVNASYNYILSGRGNITHCVEIEKSMDWCNDQSEGRMYNGTYVLCREEKDLWRVMAEFGNRATHCIRYYIQKNFMKQKGSADFQKDMRGICATFETELHNNPELAKTHTTERHSVEVNTYDACCFLMKSHLIENFNCTGESTTRYPNTPAPTVEHELRIESELKVYDDSLLSTAIRFKTFALCISVFVLFYIYKC